MSQKDYDSVPRWYVVHTYSGYENKVKADLEKTIKNRELEDYFFDIIVPMEEQIEIKEGVKTIKFGAAQLVKNICEIIVPHGVGYIGSSAFENSSISKIKLPYTLSFIDSYAFCGCVGLKELEIPEGIETLYECTFLDCKKLECVILPFSLRKICYRAFANCNSLKTIIFRRVAEFENDCFCGCISIQEIIVPVGSKTKFETKIPSMSPL